MVFEQLVKNFHKTACHWARQVLNDEDLVEDAVQEGFIKAYQHLHQLQRPEAFAGWLKQIVLRQCYLHARRAGREVSHSKEIEVEPSATADPAQVTEHLDLQEQLHTAIAALPLHQREVVKLFYFEGYAQQDIARMLGVAVGAVKKRLHEARQQLKGLLDY